MYGQSKAAGDLAVATTPKHYLIRTSWVVGDGANFVRTMERLATEGARLSVVDDQWGRLTLTDALAPATRHLLTQTAHFGTYNVTNSGPVTSRADLAAEVFIVAGRKSDDPRRVSSVEYAAGQALAPRPTYSSLDLGKIQATGFEPEPAPRALRRYLLSSPR